MLYVTRNAKLNTQCIGRAVSSHPLGPFFDNSTEPLICQPELGGSIDPSYHLDTVTGRRWVVWKNDGNSKALRCHIWSQMLTEECLGVTGPTSVLISQDQDWEGPLVEAPSITLIGNKLYLLYSAQMFNTYQYAVTSLSFLFFFLKQKILNFETKHGNRSALPFVIQSKGIFTFLAGFTSLTKKIFLNQDLAENHITHQFCNLQE